MKRETLLWLILFLIGAAMLAGRAVLTGGDMGKAYVKPIEETYVQLDADLIPEAALDEDAEGEPPTVPADPTDGDMTDVPPDVPPDDPVDADAMDVPPDQEPPPAGDVESDGAPAGRDRVWIPLDDVPDGVDVAALPEEDIVSWETYEKSGYAGFIRSQQAGTNDVVFSLSHTIGIWVAALLTLFILSFLIKDNPLYKIAESMFVGISAAYWMVVGFWDTLVPNLFAKLAPGPTTNWALPGLIGEAKFDWVYIFPLILSVMLLMRLSPKGGWLSRWPMAFFIGTFCGFRLISFIHADFLAQIRNSIVPLYAKVPQFAADGTAMLTEAGEPLLAFSFWGSVQNLILVIGVLACIVYFFFSFEHKGVVGATARLGIWFLMVTFGAAFAYTVMGRIALLAIRIEFLFDDWLWLIDPTGKRDVAMIVFWPLGMA